MYIVFKNNIEYLRYYSKELPNTLKDSVYIKIDTVPSKDNYIERAMLVDGELVWKYKPIPKLSDENLEGKVKELQETVDILLGGEEFD